MRLKSDLVLFLVAFIWGSAFAVQRAAAAHLGPFLFNGLRFLVGGAVLLPLVHFRINIERRLLPWVGLTGAALFTASFLQQIGMQYTTAGNAGFITALYVALVPLWMVIFLKQSVSRTSWLAALVAVLGALLLSTGGELRLNPGDALEFTGAVIWAVHVLLVGWLARRMEVLPFVVVQNLVSAVLNLAFAAVFDLPTLPGIAYAGWSVLYTGLFSVGVGYALQGIGQRHAPAADAALILSLEAVFAAVFGFLLLGETMTLMQVVGCALILGATLLVQLRPAPVKAI